MNAFTKNVLTGAALALGGLATAYMVATLAGRRGSSVIPTTPAELPDPIPTVSPWPWSAFSFDRA